MQKRVVAMVDERSLWRASYIDQIIWLSREVLLLRSLWLLQLFLLVIDRRTDVLNNEQRWNSVVVITLFGSFGLSKFSSVVSLKNASSSNKIDKTIRREINDSCFKRSSLFTFLFHLFTEKRTCISRKTKTRLVIFSRRESGDAH